MQPEEIHNIIFGEFRKQRFFAIRNIPGINKVALTRGDLQEIFIHHDIFKMRFTNPNFNNMQIVNSGQSISSESNNEYEMHYIDELINLNIFYKK